MTAIPFSSMQNCLKERKNLPLSQTAPKRAIKAACSPQMLILPDPFVLSIRRCQDRFDIGRILAHDLLNVLLNVQRAFHFVEIHIGPITPILKCKENRLETQIFDFRCSGVFFPRKSSRYYQTFKFKTKIKIQQKHAEASEFTKICPKKL